jgi:hypothetical protein
MNSFASEWYILMCWTVLKSRGIVVFRDRMVVGFTTTCAVSTYYHTSCEFESRTWRGVLDTTLCDKVCQWLAAGRWFSPCTPVSPTNKTDLHDITEILFDEGQTTQCPNEKWQKAKQWYTLHGTLKIKQHKPH